MAKLYKKALISLEEHHAEKTIVPQETLPLSFNEAEIKQGKKEAYEQGYLAGQKQLKQEYLQKNAQLENILKTLPQTVAQNRLALAEEIADIVLLITQQLFIENIHNPQTLAKQINQILTQLNHQHSVELFLHPSDIHLLQQGTLQLTTAHLKGLTIKEDRSLTLGGCLLKTSHGVFDASLEKQIDKLKDVLSQLKNRGAHASLAK